jgi:D-serine deaminase-like pyridoxal phosphate-dependent protein
LAIPATLPIVLGVQIDPAAVGRIRDEIVDWRFKGLPESAVGRSIGELADAGLDIVADGFTGPLLTLDSAALDHNLTTMASWCAAHGLSLMPHGKTTMAPQLFARQLELGAWGVTAANVAQVRVYRGFGVRRVQLANELVDPAGLRWVAGELARDPEFEFTCWVDSVAGVGLMDSALRSAAPARPVDVLVEVGGVGARSGVRDVDTALAVAAAVAGSPVLRLVGVAGYEGALVGAEPSAEGLALVTRYLELVRTVVTRLSFDVPEVIVTAGGSAYFDVVAQVLTRPWPAGLTVRPVLRSGAYVTHDSGFYQEVSPLGESVRLPDAPPLRAAATAWAQVTSRPEPGLALATMGKRDVPYDLGLPTPTLVRTPAGAVAPLTGWRVAKLADQHTFLVPDSPDAPLAVGDWVGFGLSHPCTMFDKWTLIPVVSGTTVVDLVRTYF